MMFKYLQGLFNSIFSREIKWEKPSEEQVKVFLENEGDFIYDEYGFGFNLKEKTVYRRWDSIETAVAYKVDLLTTDEICLELLTTDQPWIRLCESMPGWALFNQRLLKSIPKIEADWEFTISLPPFATNTTLLFDKNNRSLNEVLHDIEKRHCHFMTHRNLSKIIIK